MELGVKIKDTLYEVAWDEKERKLKAWVTVYPLPGYGNNYGTEYVIDLSHAKSWAKLEINCYNNTWATRGHGMTDSWTDGEGFARKGVAKEFVDRILEKMRRAEDETPDVKEIVEEIREFVEEYIEEVE